MSGALLGVGGGIVLADGKELRLGLLTAGNVTLARGVEDICLNQLSVRRYSCSWDT